MFYFDCELLLASANSYICNVVFKSGVKISISKWRYLRCSGQLKVSFEILVTWIPPLSQSATSFVSPNMFFTYLEKKSQISFYHLKQRKSHNHTESYSKSSYSAKSSLPSPSWSKSAIVSLIKMSPMCSACWGGILFSQVPHDGWNMYKYKYK